jgi:hypothetical protein
MRKTCKLAKKIPEKSIQYRQISALDTLFEANAPIRRGKWALFESDSPASCECYLTSFLPQ